MITLSKPLPGKVRAAATAAFIIALSLLFCSGAPRYAQPAATAADTNKSATIRRPASNVRPPAGRGRGHYFQTGTATYYGNKFHGRKTASGERYNRNKFTAAHRTLPFGTMVRVTCLSNGKTVTVRINDRGPLKGNRIIDLSRAAAKAIDMIAAGVVPVGIDIME
jgi:rare lipoprotein A